MKKVKIKAIDAVEPSYSKEETASQFEIIHALNWYRQNKDDKDAAKYLGVDIRYAKCHTTLAYMTRMKAKGYKFDDNAKNWMTQELINLKERINAKSHEPDVDENGNVVENVVSIQERIANKTDVYIGELEGAIDDYGVTGKTFNAFEWFQKNSVKPAHANGIVEYFEKRLEKFVEESTGKHTKEYFEGLDKKQLKNIRTVMETIINDATRLGAIKTVRKSRKPKVLSADKVIKKLNYLKNSPEHKIQSINPESIIGAEHLWVFNVKNRRLGLYISKGIDGLSVKGSTIINYSEASISKTVRKPEKVLTDVLNGGKIALRKLMDSINSKPSELNGRINKDTVLLRVVKS